MRYCPLAPDGAVSITALQRESTSMPGPLRPAEGVHFSVRCLAPVHEGLGGRALQRAEEEAAWLRERVADFVRGLYAGQEHAPAVDV